MSEYDDINTENYMDELERNSTPDEDPDEDEEESYKARYVELFHINRELESDRDSLREALLSAKGSLPNDDNYNDPWSLCIAIIDEALKD